MERDFMGLVSKRVLTTDSCYNSAPARSSSMQWSFSNNVSAPPQFLSFKGAQEDRSRRTGYDSLSSTGYMTMSTAESLDPNHKPYSNVLQKNLNLENQAGSGSHYAVPRHFGAHLVHSPHEARLLPITNRTSQNVVPVVNPSFITYAGQNVIGSTCNVNQPSLGGVPIIAPRAIGPAGTAIVGNTDLRNVSMAPGAPAQMTIFYAGSVCVYDDLSPEKAQAIMLLAGNATSATPNEALSAAQVQALTSATPNASLSPAQVQALMPRPSVGDGFILSHAHSTTPCLGLSRNVSVISHNGSQSAGATGNTTNITEVKPIVALKSPSTIPEPSKVVNSLGSAMVVTAVPQARKASLTRFLEKRKERVTITSPYANKQSQDCSTPGSGTRSFSAGSSPLPAIN